MQLKTFEETLPVTLDLYTLEYYFLLLISVDSWPTTTLGFVIFTFKIQVVLLPHINILIILYNVISIISCGSWNYTPPLWCRFRGPRLMGSSRYDRGLVFQIKLWDFKHFVCPKNTVSVFFVACSARSFLLLVFFCSPNFFWRLQLVRQKLALMSPELFGTRGTGGNMVRNVGFGLLMLIVDAHEKRGQFQLQLIHAQKYIELMREKHWKTT